eukprot:UN23541
MLTLRTRYLPNSVLVRTKITPQSVTKINTFIVTFIVTVPSDFMPTAFSGSFATHTSRCTKFHSDETFVGNVKPRWGVEKESDTHDKFFS